MFATTGNVGEGRRKIPVGLLEYLGGKVRGKTAGLDAASQPGDASSSTAGIPITLAGDRIPIWNDKSCRIGRDVDSSIIIKDSDRHVSRNHCEIYTIEYADNVDHIYVRDLGSFNGTYVNDLLIGSGPGTSSGYLLRHNDIIRVAPAVRFRFILKNKPVVYRLPIAQIEEAKEFMDKYRLTDYCLGLGAEGAVFMAIDVRTEKQLACKIRDLSIFQAAPDEEKYREKFKECNLLSELQHPNILTHIDTVVTKRTLYTFTDLAAGGDLMSLLARRGWIDEDTCRVVVRQIVDALDYLHTKGIVHRDVKPENILLACSTEITGHSVMLSDLGSCAILKKSSMTSIVGTSRYQAPEVFARTPQTMAVDIWSLGVLMLSVMATNYNAPSDLNRRSQENVDKYLVKVFARARPRLSRYVRNFVWRCLRVSPDERLTSAEAAQHIWIHSPPGYRSKLEEPIDFKCAAAEFNRLVKSIRRYNRMLGMAKEEDDSDEEDISFEDFDGCHTPERRVKVRRLSPWMIRPPPHSTESRSGPSNNSDISANSAAEAKSQTWSPKEALLDMVPKDIPKRRASKRKYSACSKSSKLSRCSKRCLTPLVHPLFYVPMSLNGADRERVLRKLRAAGRRFFSDILPRKPSTGTGDGKESGMGKHEIKKNRSME